MRPILLVVLSLALCGCGDRADDARGPGRLVVTEDLPPMPVYIEGSVSFLRVRRLPDGPVLVDGARTDGSEVRGDEPLLDRRVRSGRYEVVSWQRPCQGNCGLLDPPRDRCTAVARVGPAERVELRVLLEQGGGCRIEAVR